MDREVTGLLAFAGLIVLLLVAWVVFLWDGIVVHVEPASATSTQIEQASRPLTASVASGSN
jgi:hypothetical protein